jgi:hypothetical protein
MGFQANSSVHSKAPVAAHGLPRPGPNRTHRHEFLPTQRPAVLLSPGVQAPSVLLALSCHAIPGLRVRVSTPSCAACKHKPAILDTRLSHRKKSTSLFLIDNFRALNPCRTLSASSASALSFALPASGLSIRRIDPEPSRGAASRISIRPFPELEPPCSENNASEIFRSPNFAPAPGP